MEKALFGAGCFWGVEAAFRRVKGVKATAVGYSGGHLANATYKDVCSGKTGHAESVQVVTSATTPRATIDRREAGASIERGAIVA